MKTTLIEIARSQIGVKEIVGEQHNPVIINYAREIGMSWVSTDEIPWCSIFLNWCAMKAGLQRSHKADARSWLRVGIEIDVPETGDIVVFSRGNSPWEGHVGIFISEEKGFINVLGGNQGDQVKISKYATASKLGYRRLAA